MRKQEIIQGQIKELNFKILKYEQRMTDEKSKELTTLYDRGEKRLAAKIDFETRVLNHLEFFTNALERFESK